MSEHARLDHTIRSIVRDVVMSDVDTNSEIATATTTTTTTATSAPEVTASSDVLDVLEVARLLMVGRNLVYELVAKDRIPHRRLGKQIRFSRAAIMQWLSSWSVQGAKERR